MEPAFKQAIVNGVTLRYLEQGTGAPVIYVHGFIADHRTWDAQRGLPTATLRSTSATRTRALGGRRQAVFDRHTCE